MVKNEISRLYLSGESQESIANKLEISVGTVNNFVSEIIKSDDTTELQRQIAIVAKKDGVKITQLAGNLRFKNLIKLASLDDKKVEKFLDGLNMLFNKYSISPTIAANQLYSIIEIMLRDNIDPARLEEELKSKIIELKTKNHEIEITGKLLEETKARAAKDQLRLKVKEFDIKSNTCIFVYIP